MAPSPRYHVLLSPVDAAAAEELRRDTVDTQGHFNANCSLTSSLTWNDDCCFYPDKAELTEEQQLYQPDTQTWTPPKKVTSFINISSIVVGTSPLGDLCNTFTTFSPELFRSTDKRESVAALLGARLASQL